MGDVFDAMNRAKNEQAPAPGASPACGPDPAAAGATRAEAGGALPLPKPQAPRLSAVSASAAIAPDAPASTVPTAESPVAIAVERSRLDAAGHHPQVATATFASAPPRVSGPSSLNGYSPEVVVHHDRGSIVTEQYRAIRTQVLARCKNRRLQVHVVTSAAPGEGKTISSLNLGMAFAEIRNQKTLLLEADLRRPTFAAYFGRECKPGLTEYLRGSTDDLDAIIHATVYDNLQFLPAGEADPMKSTELLSSPRMVQLLDRLRDRYDFIFVDTPPVVTVTDPCILGSMADQTILVVRLNKTASQVIDRAKRLLRASNCEVAGVILTHLRPDLSRYAYRYTYGYTSK